MGNLAPIFRSSRLGVDLHYNPPGIRGEPRYLEGVVRLTKLHGSVDWRREGGPSGGPEVQRYGLPFGAPDDHPEIPRRPGERLLVYPNPAKDLETVEYPYAELFRDFAAAACQPNAVVVTYGYGFGDDHVNRVLRDMLSIPSTHLVILSYDCAGGRLRAFCDRVGRDEQITLLVGSHFGDLATLKRFSDSPCTAWARRGTSARTNAGGPMQAYSMDLRERALLDSDAGMKAADVAVKYRVSGSWVRLLKQRRRETGEVAPRVQRHGRRRMLEPHLHTLAALIAEQPDRTLAELKDALGTPASVATIWRAVAALDVTVKKNGPALRTRST